jgi:hypothetical protein
MNTDRADVPTRVDLGLDFVDNLPEAAREVRVRAVLADGGVGENFDGVTFSGVFAGPANVHVRARRVHVRAEPVGGVARAGKVRHARVVRNEASFLNELVHSGVGAAMTRPAPEPQFDRQS